MVENKYKRRFKFEGDSYAAVNRRWHGCPTITGAPMLRHEKGRVYSAGTGTQHYTVNVVVDVRRPKHKRLGSRGGTIKDTIIKKKDKTRSYVKYRYMKAPKECRLRNLINWPFNRLGGYGCAITGTYGSGKSNLMNCLIAHHLAQDISILMFNDRRFEARSLCDKGYFDKDGTFHPFQVDVMVPSGYEFTEKSDPLWNHRNNVNRVGWGDKEDIFNNLAPHKLTVVYTECMDQASALRLWIDLMGILAEEVSPENNYIYSHHEFSSLIPEVPTRDIAKTVREASNVAMNLRKDKIGVLCTFHMLSEVYYRLSQKFNYIIYRRPTLRKSMSKPEEDAQSFGRTKMNVSSGGRWRTHRIGMFPEMPDIYRIVPTKRDINYPTMQSAGDKEVTNAYSEIFNDPVNIKIMQMRSKGMSYGKIAVELQISSATVYNRAKKMEIT